MDSTPVKTLFQWKKGETADQLRLVILLQESTLEELLSQMRSSEKHCAHITTEMPACGFTVAVEAYNPDQVQKSDLHYFKCLQEPGFKIDHVNTI